MAHVEQRRGVTTGGVEHEHDAPLLRHQQAAAGVGGDLDRPLEAPAAERLDEGDSRLFGGLGRRAWERRAVAIPARDQGDAAERKRGEQQAAARHQS